MKNRRPTLFLSHESFFRQFQPLVESPPRKARGNPGFAARNVGPHSYIDETVQVLGWQQVRIGHHTVIGENTWINVNDRAGDTPAVIIGDNCFHRAAQFHQLWRWHPTIGDYCFTGPDCHFIGAGPRFLLTVRALRGPARSETATA